MSQHSTHNISSNSPTDERLKMVIDIWKHTVSVQMHFNEMEMKTRNLYFTFLAASIGLIGVVQGKRIVVPFWDLTFSVCLVIIAAVIPISMLFYFMDRHLYHRLLVGSVNQCITIENMYKKELPEIQLGSAISAASPAECVPKKWKWAFFFVTENRFRQHSRLHSDGKIEIIYKSVAATALIICILYGGFSSIQINKRPLFLFAGDCIASLFEYVAPPPQTINNVGVYKTKTH